MPSLADISTMATNMDMSLVAATMRRVLYTVANQMRDVYQLGQQQVAVLMDQTNNKDDNVADDAVAAPEIAVATTNLEVQGDKLV
eukprot:GFUD01097384.1.p1 GENE.GFUD01097384.1~~GFUD01097384.1.p1  ORF type:complete len:100 (+),score=44.03 GFUD01097384.1:48-302(+)